MSSSIPPSSEDGPITIDKIGVEHSRRFAETQKELDKRYVENARQVSDQSSIAVHENAYVPISSTLLGTTDRTNWAIVEPPEVRGGTTLFSTSCIPSLGNEDQRLVKMEAIQTRITQTPDEKTKEEGKALLSFFQQIQDLDTIKRDLESEMKRYQKG